MDPALRLAIERYFGDHVEGVVAVWCFGSYARGDAGQSSDVDVAVLLAEAPPRTLLGGRFTWQAELARLLSREVDLVVMNDAPPDLVRRVMRDGELLLDVDRSRRIAFEVRARNVWWDLEPVLRRYWAARSTA